MIELTGIRKSFGDNAVLNGVSLSVERGEVVGIIGPSGSGKSTLLRCINLLEFPDAGTVSVCGQSMHFSGRSSRPGDRAAARFRTNIGMVFQSFNLFPHMNVLDNVTSGLRLVHKRSKAEAGPKGLALLEKVGLSEKAEAYPASLSGGQRQRVAIARALAMDPQVILFDEATSALDPELVGEVLSVVRKLAEEGRTMVLVTHEMSFARDVADRIVFLGKGVVVEEGPARETIDRPATAELQSFLSHFHTR